jgi:thiosulfate/3-mercaptopyruvate sulfurtransferase
MMILRSRHRRLLGGLVLIVWVVMAPVAVQTDVGDAASRPSGVAATPAGEGYAHPEYLIEAGWLKEHLADPGLRLVGLTPRDAFAKGHIPGAAQIDWPDLSVTDTSDPSIARWQGAVEGKLTALGVTRSQRIVIYDDGTLFAARLWWILDQLGQANIGILNGGLAAWIAANGTLETGPSRVSPADQPYRATPRPELLAQLTEVHTALGDPRVALIDARSAKEYEAGHIPGAVDIEFTSNALPVAPKYWKSAAVLRAAYEAEGVTTDKRVIPYCATGVRSAVTFFTLKLLGYGDVALYTGSWKEWSSHPELPRATGARP